MQVAVYGGSFDPPHVGHVLAVEHVLRVSGFDHVVVVPVFAHAFGKSLAPYEHRVAMTRLAMEHLGRVEISTLEEELGAPSLTLRTLRALVSLHPDWGCRLVVGADVLREKHLWHAWDEVVKLAPLFLLGRAGVEDVESPEAVLPDVSSTEVRTALSRRAGNARDDATLARLVPRAVLEYIDAKALYR